MRRAPHHTVALAGSLTLAVMVGLAACGGSGNTPAASDSSSAPVATAASPAITTPAETTPGATTPAEAPSAGNDAAADQQYPDVVEAVARQDGETWTFDVTISSPYDSRDRYADGWRVLAPDGTELGFRLLTHDHASEQPFTRSLDSVEVPDDVDVVTIEGRDQANGFGGETIELTLPR